MHRVVITGLGPVTPIGIGAAAFEQAQLAGKSGVGLISRFDTEKLSVKIAGEINIDISAWIGSRELRRMDRFVHLAMVAAELALQDSHLDSANEDPARVGTLIGSGIGGITTWEEQSKIMHERGAHRISPFFIPMMIDNMASGAVAMRYGFMGPSSTVVTACATGTDAVGSAMRVIQLGEADIMFAGGAEASITPMALGGFSVMKALSTRNDSPETASRPFSIDRDGFVLAEGAGVLVLEEYEHAKARGAGIYAELVGFGRSADAYHITEPHPEGKGAILAIRAALADAHINADRVDYVNAHGTSTPFNDRAETLALKRVFGEHATRLAVSSTKSMTGHLLGATGAVEAIATAQALASGVLPPTINYVADPELDLDYLPHQPVARQVDYAISNSFAFGGQNAVLVLKRV